MNDAFPLEAQLTLYGDTMCRDTGQYFCNDRPFSIPRFGNKISLLSSGRAVFREIHRAMRSAKHFIWIADWQLSHDVELMRNSDPEHPNRLHKVIEDIIKSKPVCVRVLIYCAISNSLPGTFDKQARQKLESLNRKGYPGNVAVLLQRPTTDQKDSWDYSHHQKFVIVDGTIGFIGGIDAANGRWETPNYDVVVDPERFVINDMYNPGATKIRGVNSREQRLIDKFGFAEPWDNLIDEGCQPRMPWQDVHVKIEGPSVVDIHRNFVRRWNMMFPLPYLGEHVRYISKDWLNKIGAWDSLWESQRSAPGSALVQIVRSVSNNHLKMEGVHPEDIELFAHAGERELWKQCLPKWRDRHQNNIQNAVLNCIRSADNYVYIETQFFISGFGVRDRKDSAKIGNENNGIKNSVVDALANRIAFHIKAKTPFHVYLVIPAHPEGSPDSGAVWKQQWLALSSIKHGSRSLIKQISEALVNAGRRESEWNQYLTVLNMRNFGATVQYARDPKTNDEDFNCEIGRFVVTEQIYIHSKLLIVDDAVAIIGSANTNDRSLTGNGDTEIAAVIVDTEDVQLRDLGSPTMKVQTRKFARELRKQLWTKHFGFSIDSGDYFSSTTRATRANASVPELLPHPPRMATDPQAFRRVTGDVPLDQVLEKPCAPDVVRAIQKIAASNRKVYERVFTHTPRNFPEFDSGLKHFKLPYPLSVDMESKYSRDRLHDRIGTEVDGDRRAQIMGTRQTLYNYEVAEEAKKDKHRGVVPPSLAQEFMTTTLSPRQAAGTKNAEFGRRQQLYDHGTIHDVNKAMKHLKDELVGFFVEAPLDWAVNTKVHMNPTKQGTVDVSMNGIKTGQPENTAKA